MIKLSLLLVIFYLPHKGYDKFNNGNVKRKLLMSHFSIYFHPNIITIIHH